MCSQYIKKTFIFTTQNNESIKRAQSGEKKEKFYDCPLYGTKDRHYSDTESSLITHVLLETDVSTDMLLKKGAMLAINT